MFSSHLFSSIELMNINLVRTKNHCFNYGICTLHRLGNTSKTLECLKCMCPREWSGKRCENRVAFPIDFPPVVCHTSVALIVLFAISLLICLCLVLYVVYSSGIIRKLMTSVRLADVHVSYMRSKDEELTWTPSILRRCSRGRWIFKVSRISGEIDELLYTDVDVRFRPIKKWFL